MAIIQTSKKTTKNRYSGVDAQPWKVSYAEKPTTKVKDETFASFTEANTAAQRYIDATGRFAGAVRA